MLITIAIAGCGGGGGGSSSDTAPTFRSISGGGVKGPLADAVVTVYLLDATQPGFKGSVVDTATTNSGAAITGLALPIPLTPPYIMEITSTPGTTIDITTGLFPVITTMRTVITQQLLASGGLVYSTPLTTIATDLAIANADSNVAPYGGDNSGTTTTAEFLAALPTAALQVISTVGFGLGTDIDIFSTSPLVDNTTDTPDKLADVAAYRSAIEALTSVLYEMSQNNAGSTPDDVLSELITDLADGNSIDGTGPLVDTVVLQQAPATLLIPNSPTNQTVGDIHAILADETSTTGTTSNTSDLTDRVTIFTVVSPANTHPDIDGDGDADNVDNCPATANADQADLNANGIGDACEEPTTYYQDSDSDGYGNAAVTQLVVIQPAGYVLDNTDCNDGSAAINPSVIEVADDGIDNNCDGLQAVTYYLDGDSDGYGAQASLQIATSQPAGYVLNNTDCNDASAAAYPGAAEIVDGIDNNCDGQIDEGFSTYYQDIDGDGYGNPGVTAMALTQPIGYVVDNTDCDDASGTTYPGAAEIQGDGIDNNCDGQVDEGAITTYYQDSDSDGYGNSSVTQLVAIQPAGYVLDNTDCDDSSAAINPAATEAPDDGIDNNCDGQVDESVIVVTPLNDTGVTFGGNYPSGNNATCIGETIEQQDCSRGRDVTHNDDSDGHAGFSYTKLDLNGDDLPVSSDTWSCVRDNVTGLIWEVKQGGSFIAGDEGLHDTDDTYTWYNTDPETNGGYSGVDNTSVDNTNNSCSGYISGNQASLCNTEAYVLRVNISSLCGASNWRLPSRRELLGLLTYSKQLPAIETEFFPQTQRGAYWSSSPRADSLSNKWSVNFTYAFTGIKETAKNENSVRLVRKQ